MMAPVDVDGRASARSSGFSLLVIDDHTLFCDSIAELLRAGDPLMNVSSANSIDEATAAGRSLDSFDLILTDVRMPGTSSVADIYDRLKKRTRARVALMTGFAARREVELAMTLGFDGVLPKTMSGQAMRNAVRLIISGEKFFPSAMMMRQATDNARPSLTQREEAALRMICEGCANKEIAQAMNVDLSVVKTIVRSLCAKFEVPNRTRLAINAIEKGY